MDFNVNVIIIINKLVINGNNVLFVSFNDKMFGFDSYNYCMKINVTNDDNGTINEEVSVE